MSTFIKVKLDEKHLEKSTSVQAITLAQLRKVDRKWSKDG